MLRFLLRLLSALVSTAFARVRRGPLRPTWSFDFEALVAALRSHAAWLGELTIPELRRATAGMKGPLARGVVTRVEQIAGVPVTWFEPPHATRVVAFVHGGGFVFGSAEQDRGIASELALLLGARVAAPDYRLAPEATSPAARDDVMNVLGALRSREADLIVVGLSSGAALATAAVAELRARDKALPSKLILLSPLVDSSGARPSWKNHRGVDWGKPEAVLFWAQLYAGETSVSAPEISPVHADLSGFPPVLVVSGGAELLHDDAVALVERAREAGTAAQHHVEPDMVHAFMTLGRKDEPTTRTFEAIRKFVGNG